MRSAGSVTKVKRGPVAYQADRPVAGIRRADLDAQHGAAEGLLQRKWPAAPPLATSSSVPSSGLNTNTLEKAAR